MELRKFRLDANLSQAELGKKVGVKQSTVAMWETGVNTPSIAVLLKLAALFNCTVDELLKRPADNK